MKILFAGLNPSIHLKNLSKQPLSILKFPDRTYVKVITQQEKKNYLQIPKSKRDCGLDICSASWRKTCDFYTFTDEIAPNYQRDFIMKSTYIAKRASKNCVKSITKEIKMDSRNSLSRRSSKDRRHSSLVNTVWKLQKFTPHFKKFSWNQFICSVTL